MVKMVSKYDFTVSLFDLYRILSNGWVMYRPMRECSKDEKGSGNQMVEQKLVKCKEHWQLNAEV